jgi:hypothetical protein
MTDQIPAEALIAEARGVLAEWNRDRDWMPRSPLGMIERLSNALEAALSAHPAEETEWAGVLPGAERPSVGPYTERDRAERGVAAYNATRPPERHVRLEARRKAGPWEPVPTNANADGEGG